MLVINVELVRGGSVEMRKTIGSMQISNLSFRGNICDYRVVVDESANPIVGAPPGHAECIVLRHDRRQSPWTLLQKACEEIMKAPWVEL